MEKHLVETALLGHGLPSVTDTELSDCMEWTGAPLAGQQQWKNSYRSIGRVFCCSAAEREMACVNRENLEQAQRRGLTVYRICYNGNLRELGVRLAVTAGMGGVGALV